MFLIFTSSIAQNKYLKISSYFGFQPNNGEILYFKYGSEKTLRPTCKSYEDCLAQSPEQLLLSLISANNYQWDQDNYQYIISDDKDYDIKSASDEFNLLRKLTFSIGEEEYSMIKFNIKSDGEITNQSLLMKVIAGRWKFVSADPIMTKLLMMFKYLSIEALDAIFLKEELGVEMFDELVRKVYNSSVLDLAAGLNMKPNEPYSKDEREKVFSFSESENLTKKLESHTVQCEIVFPIRDQYLMIYVDNSYLNANEDNELSQIIALDSLIIENIKPILRFNFSLDNSSYSIFKYNLNQSGESEEYVKLFKIDDGFLMLFRHSLPTV